ncbi:carcinoembryonic antigen-related cell adhesion molecule 6-like [Hyperolius riggenbachi]|uniref:carcinoembryonic antigen-related cell adhesion molecule 6-like n=1 Tax=Hyperolius riggenbachi TaxID=752182 RepID=UPI0035A2E568
MDHTWFFTFAFVLLHVIGAESLYKVQNGILGGYVYFYETVSAEDNPAVTWSFRNAIIAQRFPGGTPRCIGPYAGRCSLFVNGTLRLDNLTSEDNGTYTFTEQLEDSTVVKKVIYELRVYYDVPSNQVQHGMLGESIFFYESVSAEDNPVITGITWSFNNSIIAQRFPGGTPRCVGQYSGRCSLFVNGTLRLDNLTLADDGTYTFMEQLEDSTIIKEAVHELRVHSPVSNVTLTSNTSEPHIWVGEDSVCLFCSSDGINVLFQWYLDGEPLPEGPHYHITEGDSPPSSTLTISPVSKVDNGPFTCEASNWMNKEISNALTFNLAYLPQAPEHDNSNVIEADDGDTIALTVTLVEGLPSVFSWFRLNPDPVPIENIRTSSRKFTVESTNFGSTLWIPEITEDDSGKYECRAQNIIGSQSFLFTVDIPEEGIGVKGLHAAQIPGIVIGSYAAVTIIIIVIIAIVKAKEPPDLSFYEVEFIVPPEME